MQKIGFDEALDRIVGEDSRYDREAYLFLRDALDYTIKSRKKQKTDLSRHVSGPELLEGVRQYALGEFGPMVATVFETWGVKEGLDIGEMVFNLVRIGIFGKTDTDRLEDFRNCYDFHDAFVKPYLPERAIPLPLGAVLLEEGAEALDATGTSKASVSAGKSSDKPPRKTARGRPLKLKNP